MTCAKLDGNYNVKDIQALDVEDKIYFNETTKSFCILNGFIIYIYVYIVHAKSAQFENTSLKVSSLTTMS